MFTETGRNNDAICQMTQITFKNKIGYYFPFPFKRRINLIGTGTDFKMDEQTFRIMKIRKLYKIQIYI